MAQEGETGVSAPLIVLHGVESVGKSWLAEDLAEHFGGIAIPEFGRTYCELNGTDCDEADLLAIARGQHEAIAAAGKAERLIFSDTDALMTAAWAKMMIGHVPDQLLAYPKGDLYLYLQADVPFVGDHVRVYGNSVERSRFDAICADMLARAGVRVAEIGGDWGERRAAAIDAVQRLLFDRADKGS